jgi:predicted Zn-dependent peptidase
VDELTRTLREGFTQAELSAAKKAIRDDRIGGRSSDAGLMRLISAREQNKRTLAWDADSTPSWRLSLSIRSTQRFAVT